MFKYLKATKIHFPAINMTEKCVHLFPYTKFMNTLSIFVYMCIYFFLQQSKSSPLKNIFPF